MTSAVLEISQLELTVPGLIRSSRILRGVDLRVNAGDVVGLVGESGCGKSMTAMACLGLVPASSRISGSIKLDGQEIVGCSDRELAEVRGGKAAMVFQNPMRSLNPFFTVGQQMIEIIRQHQRCSRSDASAAAIAELRSVHVPDPDIALGKYPHQLSGGQCQRVMIAIALACHPKLLIADEPTTALDVTVQAQIVSLLRSLSESRGLTVLFISHDLGVVSLLCNRVAVMYSGQIVEAGTVNSVIDNAKHPYTQKLINNVLTVESVPQKLDSIPGQVPHPAFLPSGCAFEERCNHAMALCSSVAPLLNSDNDYHQVACHFVEHRNRVA